MGFPQKNVDYDNPNWIVIMVELKHQGQQSNSQSKSINLGHFERIDFGNAVPKTLELMFMKFCVQKCIIKIYPMNDLNSFQGTVIQLKNHL